jgi:hypothetical protein
MYLKMCCSSIDFNKQNDVDVTLMLFRHATQPKIYSYFNTIIVGNLKLLLRRKYSYFPISL